MAFSVVLAVMNMETHGGVADQITNLALELPKHGVTPIVLIRNPLTPMHGYAALLSESGLDVAAIRHKHYQLARNICRFLSWIALPVAVVDVALRHKTLDASRRTIWSVLRRLGYAGLDLIFGLRLIYFRLLCDVRLVHFRKPDSWLWIGRARRIGLNTIYTEDTIPWEHTLRYYLGLSTVSSSISIATAVSQASANALERYLSMHRPIQVIPNMVLVGNTGSNKKRVEKDNFVIGVISRLDPQKDIETLLLAARYTVDQDDRVLFRVFGDGPLRADLEAQAHALGLDNHVTFHGSFDKIDLPKIMDKIDVVALSSHYEGFGVVLVEGMAFGKPVIATAVGGVIDVVEDGVNGFLVPPGDPKDLSAAILSLQCDQQLYKQMSGAARDSYLARFTPERVVPQYVALYQRLAA